MTNVHQIIRDLERDYQAYVAQVQTLSTQLTLCAQKLEHCQTIRERTLEGIRHLGSAIRCLPQLANAVMETQRQADQYLSNLEEEITELVKQHSDYSSERGKVLRSIREVKEQIRALAETVNSYVFVALLDDPDEEESDPVDAKKTRKLTS